MRYSQEFKDNVVARLLSKELSISEAVERYSIGVARHTKVPTKRH